MRRAQRCFFVSPPLRMRWLVAGSVGPGVTVLSPLSTERARTVWCSDGSASGQHQDARHQDVAAWRFAGNYVRTRTALAACAWLGRWDRG